ncbi:MAG: DUF2284 domain-containing protein [Ruminococcaceae bacterium]|nr:DUF2284 domain-containing protein [Oscillospiraceae bacterium]
MVFENIPDNIHKIHESATIDAVCVPFTQAVRDACKANICGKYGVCWSCPPGVGEWQELQERFYKYSKAFIYTTCHELEDSFDFEGIVEGQIKHRQLDDYIRQQLVTQGIEFELLTVGGCNICEKCTYPDSPCRFPDKLRIPMEACGIDVVTLSKLCGIHYMNGPDTVTYFSAVFYR